MRIASKTKATRELTRQEQNRRNNIKRLTISAVVALILFIALTVIQSSIVHQEDKITVYQFKEDVAEGTKITKKNLDKYLLTREVPVSLIPDDYIADSKLLLDKFTNRDYKKNDIVTTDGLTKAANTYAKNISKPVEVSFAIESLQDSVSGTIREGNYINIYGLRNKDDQNGETLKETDSDFTFKHIYIEKAYDSSGVEIASSDKESIAQMFTVIIDENDAEMFNEMIANASLKLVKLDYKATDDYRAYRNN